MRLGDLDQLMDQVVRKKVDWNNRKYMEGFNDCILRVRSMIHSAQTIDPESLPIVQELRAELERSAVESLSHFDRSRWKPCKRCGDENMLRMWKQWGRQYCTHCGRPLTDAAWEMLEKRLKEVK